MDQISPNYAGSFCFAMYLLMGIFVKHNFLCDVHVSYRYNVLRISSGLDDLGSPSWYMSVAMVAAWVLVFLCIFKGVKSIGKVRACVESG